MAVRDPVPSCLIINVSVPPSGRLVIVNPVFVPSVTLCTGANVASTVMVELDVNGLIFST